MGQLEDMQVFIRVAEAGGISRAAEQLGMAKSAVSRRVSELEKRLGTRLINRTTRAISLSEAGETYYERALQLVDNVTELNSSLATPGIELDGNIRLAAPLSFGLCHLSPALEVFLDRHPGINLNVDFSDRQVDIIEEGLDFAFRISELKDSSMVARRICPVHRVLCASPAYLEVNGAPSTIDELKQHTLLHYSLSTSVSWQLQDPQGKTHAIRISPRIKATNGDFLVHMAIAGHGIIAMPTFIAWQAIENGELLTLMKDHQLPSLNAYAVYPQGRYLSQRARSLVDFLAERFGEQPYWDKNIDR